MPFASKPVVHDLPLLSWRGFAFHCESAPLEGAHDQAERRIPYRDAAGHDHTGRAPYKMRVRIWVLDGGAFEGSAGGPSGLGGFEELPQVLELLEDPTSDDLNHPIRGPMRARVLDWNVDLSTKNLGGVSIDITFVETVDDYENQKALGTVDISPSAAAAVADKNCAQFDIDYPDGSRESSLTEAIGAVEGSILSIGMSIGGKINQVTGAIDNMIERVDSLNDPSAWPAYDSLLLTRQALKQTGDRVNKNSARPVAQVTVQNDTSLTALASELGADVNDLMGLNLSLLRSPTVRKGSVVKYYSGP